MAKQAVALRMVLVSLRVDVDAERNSTFQTISAAIELLRIDTADGPCLDIVTGATGRYTYSEEDR
ncbi:MAG TPA: hypothetical protein VHC69_29145 [Polyangiaceae bacterium]|nr:hypothetical protein [Polyangiaceae bacterium]